MEVYQAIRTMLAVREYADRPIDDAIVHRIIEAARVTGSSRNTQNWDFVVVRQRPNLQQLGTLAAYGPYIAQAALAIAVVVPENQTGFIDGTRATQDMMLAAWAAGIGSNWVGNVNTAEIKSLLKIPQERMVLTIIPFGYPAKKLGAGKKKRKAIAEIAHAEQYGQPLG